MLLESVDLGSWVEYVAAEERSADDLLNTTGMVDLVYANLTARTRLLCPYNCWGGSRAILDAVQKVK